MTRKIADIQNDLKSIEVAFLHTINDMGIFGSFLNKSPDYAHDIDIVIELDNNRAFSEKKILNGLKLSLPVVQVDINGYKKKPTIPTTGYHVLIISTEESKKQFRHINQNTAVYKSTGTLNKWFNEFNVSARRNCR